MKHLSMKCRANQAQGVPLFVEESAVKKAKEVIYVIMTFSVIRFS